MLALPEGPVFPIQTPGCLSAGRESFGDKESLLESIFKYPYTSDPEKAMATHSSTLAWKIPWMEEPGRLQSMGSLRVGHN